MTWRRYHQCKKARKKIIEEVIGDTPIPALGIIEYRSGKWMLDRDEFAMVVLFCPFCGKALK